jgi:hypothetical protein
MDQHIGDNRMPKKNQNDNPWRDSPQSKPTYMDEISRRLAESVRSAVLEHKRIGNSIAVWEDGGVRIVPADQIDELLDRDSMPRPRNSKQKSTT